MSSKRAKEILSRARLSSSYSQGFQLESPETEESVVYASPATKLISSPIPPWFDDIFEASDLTKINQQLFSKATTSVKRKLFVSPVRRPVTDVQRSTSSNGNETGIAGAQSELTDYYTNKSVLFPGPTSNVDDCISQETALQDATEKVITSRDSRHLNEHLILSRNEGDSNVIPTGDCSSIQIDEHSSFVLPKSSNYVQNRSKLYPSHVKIYEAKLALNSGKEHITPMGTLRPARNIKPPCQEKCQRCQNPRLTEDERQSISENFWSLEKHVKQWKFIFDSLILSEPKKKFAREGSKGEKLLSRVYFLNVEGKPRRVCKTMFKNTLVICDSWIDSAISHFNGKVMCEDLRGKHRNTQK